MLIGMLEGKRVQLRCVQEGDLPWLYKALDSIRMKGEYLSHELISEHHFRLTFYESGFWNEEYGMLVIIHENRLVGTIWYDKKDSLNLRFYIFRAEDRRKGLMKEALPLFASYLFSTKQIERLQISVPDYSKAAIKLVQRCKFQFEGISRSAQFYDGEYRDLCIYSLLRGECKKIFDNVY